MARLGELLIAEHLVTSDQVAEALEAQVLHGGRLGTNLCELGFLGEKDLARVLGKQHNLSFASGEMAPEAQALALVEPAFLDEHEVMPMRLDGARLLVAIIDPREIAALDALGFKTGKRIVAAVIPEFRMHQLLRKHAHSYRALRPIDTNALRPSKASLRLGGAPGQPTPASVEDLINEDDFANLYHKPKVAPVPEEEELQTIEGVEVLDPLPSPPPPPPRPTQPQGVVTDPAAFAETFVRASAPPGVAESEPRLEPLGFADAQAQLKACATREEIATVVLRFALSRFQRAILLGLQGDLVSGWRGAGVGVRENAVKRIGVFLRAQSTFKLVRDTCAHYVGPMKRDAGTSVFFKLLGGGFPTTGVLMPLLVRGKVANLLYVDQGPDQLTPPDLGELMIISQAVARSFEALIIAARR
ncbi:MAG: general secretion pathway protein GspE [Myxococcaceae bacterium]|nr:general secretion pathway protein GspE [Myxococcaceae bacterium]